jgi:hypothetical protein
MDELKMLIEMVSNLPSLAVWVLVGFLAYKVAVVGSVYGLLRLLIEKTHAWLVFRKQPALEIKEVELRPLLDGLAIKAEISSLMYQIKRVAGKGLNIDSSYIHGASVDWLRRAIDDRIAKDIAEEAAKKA